MHAWTVNPFFCEFKEEVVLVDLLKFFESIMIDRQLYWKFNAATQFYMSYEFQWSKEGVSHWRYRRCGTETWIAISVEQLPSTLDEVGVDRDDFTRQLRRNLLQQVVYADMIVKKSIAFFGQPTVDQAIDDNKKFMDQLLDTIRKLTHPEAATHGTGVVTHEKVDDFTIARSKHLRIVPPKNSIN